ncbi:phosphopentomutase [Acidimicrobiia bacterium]|nr:phosphopentomutase [Acidimicrobiia bacterium]
MTKKCILLVIDSLGVGAAPDADEYGDINANTFGNVSKEVGPLNLPTFNKLGFGKMTNINGLDADVLQNVVGRLAEKSLGNDSTTGHWEIAGLVTNKAFGVFPNGFPDELIFEVESKSGHHFIGNFHASGTEIINTLGGEHLETGSLILYTSGDSVFQIAAHEDVLNLEGLYKVSEIAREVCNKFNIGRVIARPFKGELGSFIRTYDRKDFGISPPGETILSHLKANGYRNFGVGKISDLFGEEFLDDSIHTEGDLDGLTRLESLIQESQHDLYFINLVDLDMVYGHREDPIGYYEGLKIIDKGLNNILLNLDKDDLLIITGDHGTDPTDGKTDHSREYVPLVAFKNGIKGNYVGDRNSFADIASTICDYFEIPDIFKDGTSFFNDIKNK